METALPFLHERDLTVADVPAFRERFHQHHHDVYGYALNGTPIDLQSLRLSVIGETSPPPFKNLPQGGPQPDAALKGRREVSFDGEVVDTPVFEGEKLLAENRINGPAIVEEPTTTVLLKAGWNLCVDDLGSYLLWPQDQELEQLLARLGKS